MSKEERHMAAKRAYTPHSVRVRRSVALLCCLAALGGITLGVLPLGWLAPITVAWSVVATWTFALGVRPLPILVGMLPLIAAIWLFTRRVPNLPVYRQAARIAPVAVYVDLENQLSESMIKAFVSYLRGQISPGQTADLFYYADAEEAAKSARYKTLWRYGFRPVDVPHHPFGSQNVENVVDMELALHAYERALAATTPQHIILITADQDYIPLIYRLHALGHRVSVWAKTLPIGMQSLGAYLGIETLEFAIAFQEALDAMPAIPEQTSSIPNAVHFPTKTLEPVEDALRLTLAWLD
ncbi:MAG: NYN domain-containing protein, partial [Ktedonobacterales bacterium]|nr:NYN domain-containing protein [Ktedonobacterales bacterium]